MPNRGKYKYADPVISESYKEKSYNKQIQQNHEILKILFYVRKEYLLKAKRASLCPKKSIYTKE